MQLGRKILRGLLILALLLVPPMMYLQGIEQMHGYLSDETFNRVVETGKCPPNVNGGDKEYPCTVRQYIDTRIFGGWAAIGQLMTSYGTWVPAAMVWLMLFHLTSDKGPWSARSDTKFYDGRSGTSLPPS